jgi:hypothetical protein
VNPRIANTQSDLKFSDIAMLMIVQVRKYFIIFKKVFNPWINFSETTTEYDSKIDVIQNDDPSCQDKFSNCNMVLKSKVKL